MLEYLGIGFATVLILYILKTWMNREQPNYWAKLGFPTLPPDLTHFDVLTGRKKTIDVDMQRYISIGDRKYAGIMEVGTPLLIVKDLDLAKDIFIKDFNHFFDRRDFANSAPIFTESLVFMKGQAWKDMRAFLTPTLTSGRIKRMFPHILRSGQNLDKYIRSQTTNDGIELLIHDVLRKFAVEVIGTAAFGMDIDIFTEKKSTFLEMAERFGNMTFKRKISFALFQSFPRFAEFLGISTLEPEVSSYFRDIIRTAFKEREGSQQGEEEGEGKGKDFLQILVEAKRGSLKAEVRNDGKQDEHETFLDGANKNNVVLTDDKAVSQSFIFLAAGFDTTANNLMIALYLMASYPDLQENVYQEIVRLCGADGCITYEMLNDMTYLDNFISEASRVYPAVTRIERKCMLNYCIPNTNHVIPKGTIISFISEGIHRDEKYWPNPEKFDPDRFTPENKANRNNYAYMPFGIGPRNCIGMRFALLETKVGLAYIIKSFKVEPGTVFLAPILDVFGYRTLPTLKIKFIPRY